MLLRPLAAMYGCDGTVGACTRRGFAGAPMNVGTLPASVPSGIGWAGTTAAAGAANASVAASAATGVVRSRSCLENTLTSPPQVWFDREIYRGTAIRAS